MAGEEKHFEVHGHVTGRNGRPLHGTRIVVWWAHIRERMELVSGETLEDGRYRIRYRIPEQATQPILLVVEASSEHLRAPLVSSLTEAQPDLKIDLRYEPHDQSEWVTLLRGIEPLLDGLKLSELVENSTHQDE